MAAPSVTPSSSSAYPLLLAYALVVFSLWTVDTGIVEQQSAPSGGNNAVTSSPLDPQHDSPSQLRVSSVEDLAFGSWGATRREVENEDMRRKATVALMVYATGDGLRR